MFCLSSGVIAALFIIPRISSNVYSWSINDFLVAGNIDFKSKAINYFSREIIDDLALSTILDDCVDADDIINIYLMKILMYLSYNLQTNYKRNKI